MADVTIDSSVSTLSDHQGVRSLVWTSSTVGYQFFVESTGDFVYKKSTDSGATWGSPVDIRNGAATAFDVWYEKWTPGDSGGKIHITFQDSGTDDLYYANVNTASSDTLTGPTAIIADTAFGATTWATRCCSITKARGGNLYIRHNGDGSAKTAFCRSTDGGTNWTTTLSQTGLTAASWFQLLPANTSDTQDVLLLELSASTSALALIYDDSGNSWGATTFATLAVNPSTTFMQLAASMRVADNHVIVAIWNDLDTATNDLRTFDLNPSTVGAAGTSVTELTKVITDTAEAAQCCILIDQNNTDLYVGYLIGSAWTATVDAFYKKSTDDGTTWGSATQLSVTNDDLRAIWCDLGGTATRFAPAWVNDDLNDLVTNADNSVAITAPAGGHAHGKVNQAFLMSKLQGLVRA